MKFNGRDARCPSGRARRSRRAEAPLGSDVVVGGILVKLPDGLCLDLRERLGRRRGVARLHVLHLDERGMRDLGPARKLWRKRDVVEPSPRLSLVPDEVRPACGAEQRNKRRLHDFLALHGVSDGEVLLHDPGKDADKAPPVAILSELAKPIVDAIYSLVDLVDVGVGGRDHLRGEFLQRLVRDAERHLTELGAGYRSDAEPIEERREVLPLRKLLCLKRLDKPLF